MRPVSTVSEEGRLKLLLSESGAGELWGGPEGENSAAEGGRKLQRRGLEDALSMKPIPAQAHGRWHLILQPGMAGTRNSPKLQDFRAIILQSNTLVYSRLVDGTEISMAWTGCWCGSHAWLNHVALSSPLLLIGLSESLLMYADSQLYPAIGMIQTQIEMSSSLQLSGNIKTYRFLLNFHQIGSFGDRSVHLCSSPPNTLMT